MIGVVGSIGRESYKWDDGNYCPNRDEFVTMTVGHGSTLAAGLTALTPAESGRCRSRGTNFLGVNRPRQNMRP
jgi:hypothetical protein